MILEESLLTLSKSIGARTNPWLRGFLLLTMCISLFSNRSGAVPQQSTQSVVPPAHLTAEQDHQRLMDLLHITSLRPGPSGDPKALNAANVDESKVPPYTLPDPLVMKNGKRVTTADQWWKIRRPEIVEDFDREILGRIPAHTPKVKWEIVSTTKEMQGDFPVVTKKLVGHVDNSAYPQINVNIDMSVTTPSAATVPVPVMMELSFSPEFMAMILKRLPPPPPGTPQFDSWKRQLLAKGWGYAILIPTSVQADNGEGLTQGIIGLVNKGQPRKLEDWGSLCAWAWGASRGLDYLETDKSVDAKHVGIEGLSRYGKAALVTMAYDSRFAIGFIASSGEGGAKILRRKFGEQVENLAGTGEYHWMAGNFLKYAGPLTPNDLPVDAHELIAMCAPRPVFISSGSQQVEGGWIDGRGMFLGAVGAGPVYKLLGKKDLGTAEFPPTETPLIDGDIAFRQHSGGHTAGPNWETFLNFASCYVKTTPIAVPPSTDAASHAQHFVALTFDDLPSHGPLPPGVTRTDVAKIIIATLLAAHAPPIYGFINSKRMDEDPKTQEVLQLWREAGFPLGNHGYSHMSLDANSAEAFEHDLEGNEAELQTLMADNFWHWLRFPFLQEGDTAEKHKAVQDYLREHKYYVAEVSLNFDDYAYNDPYARCVAKNDTQSIEWLKQSYLSRAGESLTQGQQMSQALYGRDIKHVMLLHIGAFEMEMLPRLLELLKRRGFQLVTLQEAESDAAYAIEPALQANWDGPLLAQMMTARHLPIPAYSESNTFEKLSQLCK
jgi:peptidoglycan/xylan/chitin deacetylase (PgdA/CDA1 family)